LIAMVLLHAIGKRMGIDYLLKLNGSTRREEAIKKEYILGVIR
jgi:hypothetical protein